jgi:hypothetical protein
VQQKFFDQTIILELGKLNNALKAKNLKLVVVSTEV